MPDRIYLDNAATSFPKPATVYDAVDHYQRKLGVAVGRGAYAQAMEVQAVVSRCRKKAADLLHAESPERIVFTFNGTDSLNVAIHGILRPGDHVVTSIVEHNSVVRPLSELKSRYGVEVTTVAADATGLVNPGDVKSAMQPNTRLVAMIHASNVVGTVQPVQEIADIVRKTDALMLVDAAQSAGHLPIDVSQFSVDLLACPGHKGLLGPLGTGLLYVRPGLERQLASFRQGGTGSNSEDDAQPGFLPDRYESGNHNAPGLFGLEAGLEYVLNRGVDSLRDHERELTAQLLEGLSGIGGLKTYGPLRVEDRLGVVSLNVEGFEPQILAGILDENFGVQARAGLHCAPGAHRCVGTFDSGGAVRLSVGPFTTGGNVDSATRALRAIAGAG